MTLTFDTMQKGSVLPTFRVAPTAEEVRAYLDSTGEPFEHWAERVPPLLVMAFTIAGMLERVTIPLGLMHTGLEQRAFRAIRHEEPLDVTITVTSYSVRRGATFANFHTDMVDASGAVVMDGEITVMAAPTGEAAK